MYHTTGGWVYTIYYINGGAAIWSLLHTEHWIWLGQFSCIAQQLAQYQIQVDTISSTTLWKVFQEGSYLVNEMYAVATLTTLAHFIGLFDSRILLGSFVLSFGSQTSSLLSGPSTIVVHLDTKWTRFSLHTNRDACEKGKITLTHKTDNWWCMFYAQDREIWNLGDKWYRPKC